MPVYLRRARGPGDRRAVTALDRWEDEKLACMSQTALSDSAGRSFSIRLVSDVEVPGSYQTALVGENRDLSAVAQAKLGENARYV